MARGPEPRLVEQRGETHLRERREVVVARGPVGAQRHVDAHLQVRRDRRHAGGQLEVGRRAVADVGTVGPDQAELGLGEPHAVGHHRAGPEGSPAVEGTHIASAGLAGEPVGLGPVLVDVGVDQQVPRRGQGDRLRPQLGRGIAGPAR